MERDYGIVERPPPDTGCWFSPSCLNCTREVCIEDEDRRILDVQDRREGAAELRRTVAASVAAKEAEGASRTQAVWVTAQERGVSRRQIWRLLSEAGMPSGKPGRPRKHA